MDSCGFGRNMLCDRYSVRVASSSKRGCLIDDVVDLIKRVGNGVEFVDVAIAVSGDLVDQLPHLLEILLHLRERFLVHKFKYEQ